MNADLQALSPLDVLAEAMELTDPLVVNQSAYAAGVRHVEAKLGAADLEAERTLLRFKIQQRLRDEGKATSDKAAEQLAKDDPEYMEHCATLRAREWERDVAEILYRILYQRASLLAKELTHVG